MMMMMNVMDYFYGVEDGRMGRRRMVKEDKKDE